MTDRLSLTNALADAAIDRQIGRTEHRLVHAGRRARPRRCRRHRARGDPAAVGGAVKEWAG